MTEERTEGHHEPPATVTIEVPVFIRDALRRLSEETGNTEADILAEAINAYMMNAKDTR
jgi:predicted DNA-binding protein